MESKRGVWFEPILFDHTECSRVIKSNTFKPDIIRDDVYNQLIYFTI